MNGSMFQDETDILKMLSGAGTPLYDILSGASSQKGAAGASIIASDENSTRKLISNGQQGASAPEDIIQLSQEAQDTLRKGIEALTSALQSGAKPDSETADLLREQLAQAREQIDFISKLLKKGATPEQAGVLGRHLDAIGQSLEKIGDQLGLAAPQNAQTVDTSTASVEAFSLSLSFNQVTQAFYDDGTVTELRQSLKVELSFAQLTATTSNDAVSTGPGGSIYSQIASQTSNNNDTLLTQYRSTAHSFRQVLADFDKAFTDRERLPLNLYNTIRNMVEAALQGGNDRQHSLDQTA